MAFNCSVAFSDIDINCQAMDVGGIKAVVLGLQCDLTLVFDTNDETTLASLDLTDSVRFEHNKKDGSTVFSESKTTSGGLGVVNTEINIKLPRLDNKVNKLDYMSRRQDIVCLMLHSNCTVTVSGYMDGLTVDYSATSGTGVTDMSFVDVKLSATGWIASMVLHNENALTTRLFG